MSHGTAHLPSSQRYYLTRRGIAQAANALGYDAPSELVRAYPVSLQWLTLLLRRMGAVAPVYRLAATLPPGVDGLETRVEFHRQGRFDAVITLRNARSFSEVRQGLARQGLLPQAVSRSPVLSMSPDPVGRRVLA